MGTLEEQVARLRAFNASLLEGDDELAQQDGGDGLEVKLPLDRALGNESITMRRRRPVLAIKNGACELVFEDQDDVPVWKKRLEDAAGKLAPAIGAVGRIDLVGNPDYAWVGTGWLVDPRFIVTNRHVAKAFAEPNGSGFKFLDGMSASIDLLHEIGREDTQVFEVIRVNHIEDASGVDLAFLEVAQIDGAKAKPIVLSPKPSAEAMIATIGYPAFDSRIPDVELMERIYGKIYDKKRLAPGTITEIDDTRLFHNCTTLGGNSGSALIDLATGEAVGLHFRGRFLSTNFAVRSDLVLKKLEELKGGTLRSKPESVVAKPKVSAAATSTVRSNATTFTIPLTVTVSLGDGAPVSVTARPARIDSDLDPDDIPDTDPELPVEGDEAPVTAASYEDRKGYDADFLGTTIALPEIAATKDILLVDGKDFVLRYEHFSVVMNKKRRQCFYSACNIDGARSKSSKRTPWRFDPRIPREMQIMNECYGNPPKFSRGHMSRREDPAWGKSAAEIQRGADDSMHVTNTTPQLQSFNAPIWLALEDYALQHAREDDQKISVFTGPYFAKSDRTMYGVRIPSKFWKVIAFIHDTTKKLCATGYEISQKKNLDALDDEDEFVFGQFRSPQLNISTQVPISTIEARAGISFDGLADVDPLGDESAGDAEVPLVHPSQIRFV